MDKVDRFGIVPIPTIAHGHSPDVCIYVRRVARATFQRGLRFSIRSQVFTALNQRYCLFNARRASYRKIHDSMTVLHRRCHLSLLQGKHNVVMTHLAKLKNPITLPWNVHFSVRMIGGGKDHRQVFDDHP